MKSAYTWKCRDCGAESDVMRKHEDRNIKVACKQCMSTDTFRVFGKGVRVWHPSRS